MEEAYIFKVFNLIVGIVGLAIGLGIILAPKIISSIEKTLNKEFDPTVTFEKFLNQKKNLTEALMKHPKIFGSILVIVSFFLLLSSMYVF
ncbi:MAG TPA: hypothetical protein PLU24_01555 [Candidatus Omnitrophota bacterium]|nr:hypothetical protein [Candidatus Omnitrophota bacterium]